MAVYYKPQSPIQSGEDFIYPITTADQVKVDEDTRLNAVGVYLKNIDNSTDTTVYGNNATTLGGVAAEDYALKTDTAPDSSKLGGIAASDYALKTDTAPDSSKLGGKAPKYYIQPRNLLDNSDFTNTVNQRGATSYDGAHGYYCMDRWVGWAETSDDTPNVVVQKGYVTVETGGKLQQKLESYKPDTVYTAAAKRTDGTLLIVSGTFTSNEIGTDIYIKTGSDGLANFGLRSGDYLWAALYEGSYTAETLPPYVPKGYAAELAECMRYYKAIKSTAGAYGTTIDAQTGGFVTIDTGIAMYRTPSIILLNELGYLKAGGASYRVTELAINSYDGSMATLKVTCGNSTVPTGNACVLVNTHLAMSADL